MDEEFSSLELHHISQTAIRESLEEDFLDSVRRKYHKDVAKLQLKTRERISNTLQRLCDQMNEKLKKISREKSKRAFIAHRQAQWDFCLQTIKNQMHDKIRSMQDDLCYKERTIEKYCRRYNDVYATSA